MIAAARRAPDMLILAGLIMYQGVMYGWVIRAYLHVSVVLLPYLIGVRGYTLYDEINIGYPPGWLWFNSLLYRLLPADEARARLGTILIAVGITLIVYALGRKLWGRAGGLLAAALFATWGPLMLEYLLYFEFALGLLVSAAFLFWHERGAPARRVFAAGICVGLAVIIKHHTLAVIAAYGLWRLAHFDRRMFADGLYFGLGAALPIGFAGGIMALQGVLPYGLYLMTGFNTSYFDLATEIDLSIREIILLIAWLVPVPVLGLAALRRRDPRALLILLLLVALFAPAYPRYGRFHLSGALPFAALAGAGGLIALWSDVRWRQILTGGLAAGMIIMGAGLPVYYRISLGMITSQYANLIPIVEWLRGYAPPETRLWVLPDIDPTGNLYAIGQYLPPAQYAQTYPWIIGSADLWARVLAGLESDPPVYVVRVDNLRFQVPQPVWDYVDAHYTAFDQTTVPELGALTLYRRKGE